MTLLFKPIFSTLSAAALLAALALPTFAQDTTDTAETPVEPDFSMGEAIDESGAPVAQEPQPGQEYLADVFDDWALRCLRAQEGDDPCQMYQLMRDGQGNDVAEVAIVSLTDSGAAIAGATIVVPLGTLLTEQITLRVDGGQARRFPFNFCNAGGCVSRLGLTADDIALFRRGAEATLSVVPAAAPDQTVTVGMSLAGFTAAFAALTE